MRVPPENPRCLLNPLPSNRDNTTVVFGGGLAGLSAGYVLAKADKSVIVLEKDSVVGGLAKTVVKGEFRFDLGGHRFITKDKKVEDFVTDLLESDFLSVTRKSKIYMRKKLFDYPLRPSNALFGLGLPTTLRIFFDYLKERIRNSLGFHEIISLEDWVVSNFGRTMFNLYFKDYSEKVWGMKCNKISKEWVEQRIKGLSLWTAIKNAFFKYSGSDIDTLADKFIYPSDGIGRISEKLREKIEKNNKVLTDTGIIHINHNNSKINSVLARNYEKIYDVRGCEFISSIPLTNLVRMLKPAAPVDVLEAAAGLKYRDLIIVTIMLDRDKVTDLTWLYLPEKDVPIGRIHEPKNWSPDMAPDGKTHIVSEYFCFENDKIWNSKDDELVNITVDHLGKLGFINSREVIDSCVIRVPKAYPLFEIGYSENYAKILEYLKRFSNLAIVGRSGMFRYYNMDHAIESGITAAENILRKPFTEKKRESQFVEA